MALVAASIIPSCVCHASWRSTRVVTIVFGMIGRPSGPRGKAMKLVSEESSAMAAWRGARGGARRRTGAGTAPTRQS